MYLLKRWRKNSLPQQPTPHLSFHFPSLVKTFLPILPPLLFNLFFLWPFFGQDYPQVDFSAPFLPFLASGIDFLTPLNFTQGVGILVLLSFPLSSLTWYFFFRRLSGSVRTSLLASLVFLLPWVFLPRFSLFWQKGDGLHALGFALVPLAGILFLQFLRQGSFNLFLTSSVSVSLISLVSPFALLNLYLFFLVLTFSEMLLGQARIKLLRFLLVPFFALGFSSFWYHPQFLLSIFKSPQGQAALTSFWKLFPISFFTVPIFGALSFLIFDRKPNLQSTFFALIFTTLYLGLTASENFGGYLPFPVPDRFSPEFYIGFSFFLALFLNFAVKLPRHSFSFLGIKTPHLAFAHHASNVFLTALNVGFISWPLFSLLFGDPLISPVEPTQVLGVQTAWWEFSRGGVSQFVGYGITLATLSCGVVLKKKIKA